MSVCKDCGAIGGFHGKWCASRLRTSPAPKPARQYRIEWCGNIQVHHPVKPTPSPKEEAKK